MEVGMRSSRGRICNLVVPCLLVGCGYKTNPRPATATIPGEIALMTAQAYPDRVVLKWEVPRSNVDGSSFKDASGFKLYRFERKTGEECENCEAKKTVYANVDFQNPVNATIDKGEVLFVDKAVQPGTVYQYWVNAYNLKGREGGLSPEVEVDFDRPPPAPEGLRATPEPKGIAVEWTASSGPEKINGYRVYRGENDNPEAMKLIGSTGPSDTSFMDKGAEKGKTYYFLVRSLKVNRGVSLESRTSPTVKLVVPQIHTPPPENVKTALGREGISIVWNKVEIEKEEPRYNVYRSEGRKLFVKINPEPLLNPQLMDKKVVPGRTYRYAVTAFPSGKPEYESNRTASEAVKYTR